MNIAVFVSIWSVDNSSVELNDIFRDAPLDFLKGESAVGAVEIYTPETGDVPKMEDIPAPTIIIQIDMNDAGAAQALVSSDKFQGLFMDKTAYSSAVEDIKLEITKAVHFPLPGNDMPPPRTAAMSFVVRYYGPVKDAAEFVGFYTNNHPPILSNFPGIRNVLCYLPLDCQNSGEVIDNRLIIGNEVVFDDLDGLKAALSSDVLALAQEDSKHFQHFGYSTHHAMHRELVYSRPD
ncbi:MAG: hypothetical protein HN764_05335 [Gammaproteobacteria bacterium]|jgi:hypothetical protein|nr:hypothetical protein [Gammaproteobacteria bacterium]